MMLPCSGCAYREEIPGDAHSRCAYDWRGHARPTGDPHGVRMGWFSFPLNYDPTWGPNECAVRSEQRDDTKVRKFSPFEELISLLGGHRF